MLTITKNIEFDAGHRVLNHKGKCRFPHGHRYRAQVHLAGDLDTLGMVVDFGEVKRLIGEWVDENVDHGFMVSAQDHELRKALFNLQNNKVLVMPWNPTAENLAKWFTHKFREIVPQVVGVTLYETPNSSASFLHGERQVPDQ